MTEAKKIISFKIFRTNLPTPVWLSFPFPRQALNQRDEDKHGKLIGTRRSGSHSLYNS